jgi:hypothetical protein
MALCRFKDAFDVCDDANLKLLLLVKIAECFAESDINAAHIIISDIIKRKNSKVNTYINENYEYIFNKSKRFVIDKKYDAVYKVDLHNSIFPPDIAERYKEIIDAIKFSIL